jgi:hypothetical protein
MQFDAIYLKRAACLAVTNLDDCLLAPIRPAAVTSPQIGGAGSKFEAGLETAATSDQLQFCIRLSICKYVCMYISA